MGYSNIVEKRKLSDDDLREIIRLHKSGVSMRKLGRDYGVSHRSIGWRLKHNSIDKNGNIIEVNRKPKGTKPGSGRFNWDKFSKHCELEKAYWAGFIMADGSISHNTLRIEISNKDKNHLDWWLQFGAYIKYNTNRASYFIRATHPNLIEWLNDWEIKENKTGNEKLPNKPKYLIFNWLRGLIDGDGWVSKRISGGICSSSCSFLKSIKTFLKENNINCKFYEFSVENKKPHYKIEINKRMLFHLYELINGHPRLERKWKKVEASKLNSNFMSDSTINKILKLKSKRLTCREISEKVGHSYDSVKYRLRKGGVPSVTRT